MTLLKFTQLPGGNPYELKNLSRVILRTVPFRDPKVVLTEGEVDKTPPPCHMTVFRNAQGLFLPAVSDNDEYQYWRIQKAEGGMLGEPIRGGDTVRLSWKFSDQTVGFRDFKDDVFGRRRNHCPPELSSTTLHLKVPWPRFECENNPTALVMSPEATTNLVGATFGVLPGKFEYVLQDLQLRIDTVENRSAGDSADYMLRGVEQGKNETKVGIVPLGSDDPISVWTQISQFGIST